MERSIATGEPAAGPSWNSLVMLERRDVERDACDGRLSCGSVGAGRVGAGRAARKPGAPRSSSEMLPRRASSLMLPRRASSEMLPRRDPRAAALCGRESELRRELLLDPPQLMPPPVLKDEYCPW